MSSNVMPVLVNIVAGQPVCVPEVVDVTVLDTLLSFTLTDDDYHFPDAGAVVVADGGTDFPCASWTLRQRQAALLDLNQIDGRFSYTVTVVHTASGRVMTVDPIIKNGA